MNTLQSIGLPVRDRATMPRPQSAQAALASTLQQYSQERSKEFIIPQNTIPSSIQPTPPPPYASSHLPAPSQRVPKVTGTDQDDFSRSLLPAVNRNGSSGGIRFTSRLTQQLPVSSADFLHPHGLSTEFRRVPSHLESRGFDGQSNPYGLKPTRPKTAPVTNSEHHAPDTIPLSLMLPPDRVLPFLEERDGLPDRASESSKSSQCQPASSTGIIAKPKPKASRTKPDKAKTPTDNSKRPANMYSPLEPSGTTAPYNLRPSSSSSSASLSRPAPFNVASAGSSANMPALDKIVQSRAKLTKEGWALNKADFLKYFNEEAFFCITFVDELVRFAKIQKSFEAAYPLLVAAQKARRDRLGTGHNYRQTFREWTSNDVKFAISAHRGLESETPAVIASVMRANTPKKRARDNSPILKDAREETQEPAPDVVQGEVGVPSLSTLSFSPVTPISSRKRPASNLEETSGNAQTESTDIHPVSRPVLEQQAAAPAANHQMEPAIAQPDPATTIQEQSAVAATSVLPTIQPSELTLILDEWAQNSKYLSAIPKPAPTPKEVLAAFAAQDQEARIKSLDELIRDYIDDENFGKLAEDIEGTWMGMAPRP